MKISSIAGLGLAAVLIGCSSPGSSAGEKKLSGEARSVTAAGLSYQVPAAWKETPPSSNMRAAQYSLPAESGGGDAPELVLFYFGEGQGGNTQANIDRWIGQMQQAEGKTSEEAARKESRTVGSLKVSTVRLNGTYNSGMGMGGMGGGGAKPGYRMWCAVVEGPGGPWFFKATGPQKALEKAENDLDAMLSTVKPGPAPSGGAQGGGTQ